MLSAVVYITGAFVVLGIASGIECIPKLIYAIRDWWVDRDKE